MKTAQMIGGLLVSACMIGVIAASCRASTTLQSWPLTPGLTIDRSNADRYVNEMTAGLRYAVQHGLTIKVGPAERVEWPARYQTATEQHSAQVVLDEKGALRNYVAGLPFPNIDQADQRVALKIAYNWRWGPFIPAEVSVSGIAARLNTFLRDNPAAFAADLSHDDFRNELTCDQAVLLRLAHRLTQEGAASQSDPAVDWEERGDRCGPEQGRVIALIGGKQSTLTELYVFFQATRKWRRMALPVAPNQSCTYSCSQMVLEYMPPSTEFYDWKFAGKTTLLGCMRGGTMAKPAGGGLTFGELSCEPRNAYVLDMTPRTDFPDLLRARVYIDSETFVYLGGEVWRDSSMPDLSAAVWTRNASPEGLELADDIYVPSDRSGSFLLLDLTSRQRFAQDLAPELFNPKAQQ